MSKYLSNVLGRDPHFTVWYTGTWRELQPVEWVNQFVSEKMEQVEVYFTNDKW